MRPPYVTQDPCSTTALATHLAGIHVGGQLEAPSAIAVTGVAAQGVAARLLTASLCTLIHICRQKVIVGVGTELLGPVEM